MAHVHVCMYMHISCQQGNSILIVNPCFFYFHSLIERIDHHGVNLTNIPPGNMLRILNQWY